MWWACCGCCVFSLSKVVVCVYVCMRLLCDAYVAWYALSVSGLGVVLYVMCLCVLCVLCFVLCCVLCCIICVSVSCRCFLSGVCVCVVCVVCVCRVCAVWCVWGVCCAIVCVM